MAIFGGKTEKKATGEAIRFEVQYRMGERWVIEVILEDADQATEQARDILKANEDYDAVRVIRHRTSANGFESENEIYALEASKKEKIYRLGGKPEAAMLCQSADDLRQVEARMALSSLLRDFLEEHGLTATELLYSSAMLRRLADAGSLLSAAIYQVSMAHAEQLKIPVRERVAQMEGWLRIWLSRGAELMTDRRRLPPFDPEMGLARLLRRIEQEVSPEAAPITLRGLLMLWLQPQQGVQAKMAAMLDLIPKARTEEAELWPLIDEITADALMSADIVQELFGAQPSLRHFLCALADFLINPPEAASEPEKMDPLLHKVGILLSSGHGKETRAVLTARLLKSVGSTQPLDKKHPDQEKDNLARLTKALTQPDGSLLGGDITEAALTHRRKELRRQQLRALGMHDAADAV